jgi:hypothetical protein
MRLGLASPTTRADNAIRKQRSQVEHVRAECEQFERMAEKKRKSKSRRTGEIGSIEQRLLSVRGKHERLTSEVAQDEANLQCLLASDFAIHEEALQTLLLINAILLNTTVKEHCADLAEEEAAQLEVLQAHLKAVLVGEVDVPCLDRHGRQQIHSEEASGSHDSSDGCDASDEEVAALIEIDGSEIDTNEEDVDDFEDLENLQTIERALRQARF